MTLRQSFTDFIFATNTDGSGKAASYVRALDMLGPILTKHYPKPIVGGSMWHGFTLSELKAIHEWLCAEARKGKCVVVKGMIFLVFDSYAMLRHFSRFRLCVTP